MPNISMLIGPSFGVCNMQCKYRFYHDEARSREVETYGLMSAETLEADPFSVKGGCQRKGFLLR